MSSSQSSPRPILKRTTPAADLPVPRTESKQLLRIDPGLFQPIVRFPSTSSLTCTFLVHSPSTYDRSPIVVSPNQLALPERGCPGQTYYSGDERLSAAKELASRNNGGRRLRGRSPSGRHLRSHARIPVDSGQSESAGKLQGEDPGSSKGSEDAAYDSSTSTPSSPMSSPRTAARALSEIASNLASLCINPRSRPPSPLAFRTRNFMSFSRSSSPASSCATSPASSRSSSPCRDILTFTPPSSRRRHNLSARARQSRTPSDPEPNFTSYAESSLLSLDSPDDGCLGGF